jgi:hypothetical protein
MRSFTDAEILKRVEGLPTFRGWKRGIYDVWVRSKADEFDKFDDKAFTYSCSEDGQRPRFIMARTGTSNSGSYGLLHFDQYNHKGCAVLKSDCMVYNSHVHGKHKGKEAYVQNKPFPYFRDNNRNRRAEEIGPEFDNDIIGANIHRAGVNSTVIYNWSTACMVTAQLEKYLEFLHFCNSVGNTPVTLVILKEF